MIAERDIAEVKSRDFLKIVDHYHDFDDIKTDYVFGYRIVSPFLTVIIPVYDHPIELIVRAINSVLYQKYDYLVQVLIIDDNSDNENTNLIQFLKKLDDKRIIYFKNEKNLGVFANWNRGIQLSNSPWVTILHTDDFYKENYLQNMKNIIDCHPEIDQLACNYKLLNYQKGNFNISEEFKGDSALKTVRKVKYTEYFYEMKTSVKGSIYRRDKLIEIGGFRNQGSGLGLDDYPLMLKFAYYFNTYLLEDNLYVDSWGYNDSLNTKHWYPELIENYYMWIYFANKEKGVIRNIYLDRAKILVSIRAKKYNDGSSWVGKPIPIDFSELKTICNLKTLNYPKIEIKVNAGLVKVIQYIRRHPYKKFKFHILNYPANKSLN